MPASLPWAVGEWPVYSWLALLSYSLNPLFCEWARLCIRLESFTGQFSLSLSFSPVSLAIHSLGCYFTLAPSDCPQSIQSQSLSSVHNPRLPVQPQLAGAGRQHLGYFSAGFQLGNSFFFFFFPPRYVSLWDSKTPQRPTGERASCCLETSPPSRLLPQNVSLFVFYILSYLFSKRMGCLSGCLVSSARIQKLFCGSFSAFQWSSDEFMVEKLVSLSYSSAILGPTPLPHPPPLQFVKRKLLRWKSLVKTIVKLSSHFYKVGILFPEEMISNYIEGRGFQKFVDIRETQKAC